VFSYKPTQNIKSQRAGKAGGE